MSCSRVAYVTKFRDIDPRQKCGHGVGIRNSEIPESQLMWTWNVPWAPVYMYVQNVMKNDVRC